MEQLSLPYRIALIAIAAVGVLWFVALRPGGSTESAAPAANAPGVNGLSNAVTKANSAAAQAAAANAAAGAENYVTPDVTPVAQGSAPETPSASSSTTGKVAAKDRSGAILSDLRSGRVAVVAFAGVKAADDQGVRSALAKIDRHGGKVVVRSVSIADVARYGAITRGVTVAQAPTVLVIGKDRKARSIVGFTDTREIDQLVSDVGGKGF